MLDMYVFSRLSEVKELKEKCQREYNEERPHESLGNMKLNIASVNVNLTSILKIVILLTTGIILPTYTVYGNHDDTIKKFPVNFVVLSSKHEVHHVVGIDTARKEIEILNTFFTSEQREPIVHFQFKSFHSYNDIKNSECEFIKLGDFTGTYNSEYWQDLFNACNDSRVVDPTAINFYIYDSYSPGKSFADKDSHGKNNLNQPYIIIDWERLNHQIQSPEEHEMGHAFGLTHVCVPGATPATSTNIMASKDCKKGSGGRRDIGFDQRQRRLILRNAEIIKKKLRNE